jgi:hypothetical protein
MPDLVSTDQPVFAVPDANLTPVSDHLGRMAPIPPSRMFLINKGLKVFQQNNPGVPVFDASQGEWRRQPAGCAARDPGARRPDADRTGHRL